MRELTSSDRKKLKALAHHIEPVVMVGKSGITPSLIEATDLALEARELIKVKFIEFKKEKRALSEQLAQETRSAVVDIIGHVVILFREQEDEEKRQISLD